MERLNGVSVSLSLASQDEVELVGKNEKVEIDNSNLASLRFCGFEHMVNKCLGELPCFYFGTQGSKTLKLIKANP